MKKPLFGPEFDNTVGTPNKGTPNKGIFPYLSRNLKNGK